MNISTKLLKAAAGQAGGAGLDVDEVFSTFLYTGTGSDLEINNGIDLSNSGGLIWAKSRGNGDSHWLVDTERGLNKSLRSNTTAANNTGVQQITSFDSDGFTLGNSNQGQNYSGLPYVSWTFRNSPMFQCLTYTGNGSSGKTVSHNLGSEVGMLVVKRTDSSDDWRVYHRAMHATPRQKYLGLNSSNEVFDMASIWNDTAPTSTQFTVGNDFSVNQSGGTYVAYLFSHHANDGSATGFGPDGDSPVISCGSYTGNQNAVGPVIDLGFEPQWLLIKNASAARPWLIIDVMRGTAVGTSNAGVDQYLEANTSDAEDADTYLSINATGFQPRDTGGNINASGETYIYMAIRRGPLAAPTDATKVFAINTTGTNDSPNNNFTTGLVPDMNINTQTSGNDNYVLSRLLGSGGFLRTNSSAGFSTNATATHFGGPTGTIDLNTSFYGTASNVISYSWKRAPGYFDCVCYSGTGSNRTVPHGLQKVPEMMWVKRRNSANNWSVYHSGVDTSSPQNYELRLNSTTARVDEDNRWNDTAPTSSVFTVGTSVVTNNSSGTYIAYLFATVPNVSFVGSYTGDGNTGKQISCGFTNGARFVLIKASSGSGGWLTWDGTRGIVSGNDPYLLLNTTDAEETSGDNVDPYSAGFIVNGPGNNASGVTYIFYAIA